MGGQGHKLEEMERYGKGEEERESKMRGERGNGIQVGRGRYQMSGWDGDGKDGMGSIRGTGTRGEGQDAGGMIGVA